MRTELKTALGPDDPDDGDEGRRQRGIAIAVMEHNRIRPDRFGYKVPSQSGKGTYLVNLEYGPYCTCPDFEERSRPCKHVYAVQALIRQDERLTEPPPPPVAVRMPQTPWQQYNAAQVNEGDLFARLLRNLCDTIEQPPCSGPGRRPMPLGDMMYGLGLKVYSTLSTRRAMSVMGAAAAGRMSCEPSYSTPIRYFGRAEVTPLLRELIQRSALPLRDIEVDFAQDSSGFSSTAYNRWFDHKWGKGAKREVKWAKVHVMCGVLTNIVTVADATATQSADSPYMVDFVRVTAENFHIREVSGDLAYSSRANLHAVADAGGTAYIPFKTNAVARQKGSGRKTHDALWEKMYHLFTLHEAEFNQHYHKRSNVETVFHMMKAKFGDKIRAKTDTAMVNEALVKVLCHNVCVLIRAMYTLGITPVFDDLPDGAADHAAAA